MKRAELTNAGIHDNVAIPGTSRDMRSGFPSNVRINQADTTDNDGQNFVTLPLMVPNFGETTFTQTSRYGEVLMSRNHDCGKTIPRSRRRDALDSNIRVDRHTLSVVQVNSILHKEFRKRVEAIETDKYRKAMQGMDVPDGFEEGMWTIDYNDHVDLARELGSEWTLTGMSMTAPDVSVSSAIHMRKTRMLVVAKRGSTECINLWGSAPRGNDRLFLVLKMVPVSAKTSYRPELMLCETPGVPHIVGAIVGDLHYVPQYTAVSSQHCTPHESLASYVVQGPDKRFSKYRAPYSLVGVLDLNRSVDKIRRSPVGSESPLVDTKVVYRNPEIYVHLFIS